MRFPTCFLKCQCSRSTVAVSRSGTASREVRPSWHGHEEQNRPAASAVLAPMTRVAATTSTATIDPAICIKDLLLLRSNDMECPPSGASSSSSSPGTVPTAPGNGTGSKGVSQVGPVGSYPAATKPTAFPVLASHTDPPLSPCPSVASLGFNGPEVLLILTEVKRNRFTVGMYCRFVFTASVASPSCRIRCSRLLTHHPSGTGGLGGELPRAPWASN